MSDICISGTINAWMRGRQAVLCSKKHLQWASLINFWREGGHDYMSNFLEGGLGINIRKG